MTTAEWDALGDWAVIVSVVLAIVLYMVGVIA
jgi:hypothetical protein